MCLAIYVIVIVQSAGLNSLSTLNFFKEGHVFEILDACIIDTQPLLINSRGQCASQCGMNSLCIAFDYCSLNGSTPVDFALDNQHFQPPQHNVDFTK